MEFNVNQVLCPFLSDVPIEYRIEKLFVGK